VPLHCNIHSHAAAALINFCAGVERNVLVPYLDPNVERLLKLLNAASENAKQPRSKVMFKSRLWRLLAKVADVNEPTFGKVGFLCWFCDFDESIADICLYMKLSMKAIECAGLHNQRVSSSLFAPSPSCAAIAVGRYFFRPRADTLVELLM